MKKLLLIFLAFALTPIYAAAQTSVVVQAKSDLKITTNAKPEQLAVLVATVAFRVKGGHYKKTSGNNCLGYSCDVVCFADGTGRDILIDAEGSATPQWSLVTGLNASLCEPVTSDPSGGSGGGGGGEVPPNEDLKEIIKLLQEQNELLKAQNAALVQGLASLKAEIEKGVKIRW